MLDPRYYDTPSAAAVVQTTHCGFMGRVLVDFRSDVCCAVLLLLYIPGAMIRPAISSAGRHRCRSPAVAQPLARRRSIARRCSCVLFAKIEIRQL